MYIYMYICIQIVCVGVLVGCAVALSAIADSLLFEDDTVEEFDALEDDRDIFRAVAGWLLFASIAGIVSRIAMVVIRGVFYLGIIDSESMLYLVFAVLVSFNKYIAS